MKLLNDPVNRKWEWDELLVVRKDVLQAWPTGQEVNLEEAVEYHKHVPANRIFARRLARGLQEGITLAQPRAGVAMLHEHIELLQFLANEGEADLLPTTIDSYTRQNRYQEAQNGLEESRSVGRSMLNGFPAVNHGVARCRQLVEAVPVPVQVRHGTPDARLLAEVTLAGGFTAYEGGGISYNIPYAKEVSLAETIRNWQYVDRLVGWYEEQGVSINREPFGPLTGTLVPPSISHCVGIIEALLAAQQGVKSISLGYGQLGNLTQDVAAIQSLKELADEYLCRFGFGDVTLNTVFHQWMGGFPQDESKAFGVIGWGAATAALAGATKVIVKTPHEALGIPSKEANAAGIKATKQILTMLKDQRLGDTEEVKKEKQIIHLETKALMERVLALGEGDVAQGAIRAFSSGVIDVPFAPSKHNPGKILPARDRCGAVRLLEFGTLPFDDDIKHFHREKLQDRGRHEGREPSFQMVVDDIYAIGKGMLVGKRK